MARAAGPQDKPDLLPQPRAVVQAFGRDSIAFGRARLVLQETWNAVGQDPEVRLKRDLWHRLLAEAYGDEVGEDPLFLQHTYLTIVVKAIAARVLDLPVDNPADPLAGRALADEGIIGAVEADFFDWPLKHPAGVELIRDVAQQTARFRLRAQRRNRRANDASPTIEDQDDVFARFIVRRHAAILRDGQRSGVVSCLSAGGVRVGISLPGGCTRAANEFRRGRDRGKWIGMDPLRRRRLWPA